jgi:hypothetical protein
MQMEFASLMQMFGQQAQCFNELALANPLLTRIQSTPFSTARVSCQGRPRLSSRRAGRKIGSTTSHCSSVSSQRPAMAIRRDALSNSSFADFKPQNVYEMGSSVLSLKSVYKIERQNRGFGQRFCAIRKASDFCCGVEYSF